MSALRLRVLITIPVLFFAATLAPAKRPKPQFCPDGRLLIGTGGNVVATTAGQPVFLVLHGGRLTVEGACAPTSAKAKVGRKGTKVGVTWKACNGLKRVKLAAKIPVSCDTLSGTIAAKHRRPTPLAGAPSVCGDLTLDAAGGEQCDATACPNSGTCGGDCQCAPAAIAQVTGHVTDLVGPVAGVTVSDLSGTPSGQTDATGRVTLSLSNGVPHTLRIAKTGYADVVHVVNLPLGTPIAHFDRSLMPRDAAQPLDAAAGGTITGRDGAKLVLPPNALVDANGQPVTGTVQVSQTPLDVSGDHLSEFPGDFMGMPTGGGAAPIATYGTVEYALEQNGQRLRLANGKTATLELPIYTAQHLDGSAAQAGDTIPFWSLDEQTGMWMQEGVGTVVASAGAPTGLALQVSVPHFSWWNCDAPIAPPDPYQPKPRCYIDLGNGMLSETECSLGPQPYGVQIVPELTPGTRRHSRATVPPAFNRKPNYSVRDFVPIGGRVEPLPAGLGIIVRACNLAGTHCTTKTLQGASGVAEDVAFNLVPIDSGNGDHITSPWSHAYAIDPAGQVDHYTFDGQAGETYAIGVARATTAFLEGTVTVGPTGGAVLDSEVFDAIPGALTVTLPQTGTYEITVDGTAHEPGAYTLTFTKLTPQAEVPITLPYQPSVPSITFTTPAQLDRFVLSATQGQTYMARFLIDTYPGLGGSGTLRARLRDGTELARARVSILKGSDLIFTAPSTAEIVLEAATQQPGPRAYDIFVFPVTAGADEAIAVPFHRTDQLTTSIHRYRVTTTGPTTIRTTLSGNLYPYLSILSGETTLDTNAYVGYWDQGLTTTLPTAGEYVVALHCGYGCPSNLPTTKLEIVEAPEIVPGTATTGTIAQAGDVTSFTFLAEHDAPYFVDAYGDPVPAQLGRLVSDEMNNYVDRLTATIQPGTAPTTGRYTIDVRAAAGTGSFTLGLHQIAPPTPVAFVGNVATATGSIDLPGQQRYYSIPLTQGDQVKIAIDTPIPQPPSATMPGLGGTAQLLLPTSVARFWEPQVAAPAARTNFGASATNSGHAETTVYTAPQTATYTVGIVHGGQHLVNATGAYTWTVTKQ